MGEQFEIKGEIAYSPAAIREAVESIREAVFNVREATGPGGLRRSDVLLLADVAECTASLLVEDLLAGSATQTEWPLCSICRQPELGGRTHNHACE